MLLLLYQHRNNYKNPNQSICDWIDFGAFYKPKRRHLIMIILQEEGTDSEHYTWPQHQHLPCHTTQSGTVWCSHVHTQHRQQPLHYQRLLIEWLSFSKLCWYCDIADSNWLTYQSRLNTLICQIVSGQRVSKYTWWMLPIRTASCGLTATLTSLLLLSHQ